MEPSFLARIKFTGWLKLATVAFVIFAICITSIPLLLMLFNTIVPKYVVLQQGGVLFNIWENPPMNAYLRFYAFDLMNPDEVLSGTAKPVLQQKGPYVYRETKRMENIIFYENDTLSYQPRYIYEFVRDMSVGDDSDLVSTVNLVLMTALYTFRTDPELFLKLVSLGLDITNEKPIVSRSIHDVLWGYKDPLLTILHRLDPIAFYTEYCGILNGRNDTLVDKYTVYSTSGNAGEITIYNGMSTLSFWPTPFANMLNGSDGVLFPPMTTTDSHPYVFVRDLCRSISLDYVTSTRSPEADMLLLRFHLSDAAFSSEFCYKETEPCSPHGLMDGRPCQLVDSFHIPIYFSLPHFTRANSSLLDQFVGLSPSLDLYDPYIDIEPYSGIAMRGASRLQINVLVTPSDAAPSSLKLPKTFFPVAWFEEYLELDAAHCELLRGILYLPRLLMIGLPGGVGSLAAVIFVVSLILHAASRRARAKNSETQPILANDAHNATSVNA